jgi:hypothetical protein
MTEGSDLQPTAEAGKTVMYRPAAEGGLAAAPPEKADYREGLRSRRWSAAPLENPEVEKTDPRIAVAAIVALSVLTLLVLVIGYGVGVWGLT